MTRLLTALAAACFACAVQAHSAPTDMQKAADENAEVTPVKLGCLKETGSHIKNHSKDGCMASPGRSYTREDLAKTGGVDLADSLRRLSPSISVHN